ncbi:MAG: response regulator transcription factor [Actinomycetota bacterium]
MSSARIMVVDDQAPFRRAVLALGRSARIDVIEAEDRDTALAALDAVTTPVDLVLVDVMLGPESGIDLTRELLEADPRLPVVLVSTMDERDLPSDAATCGAWRFVPKSMLSPDLLDELVTTTDGVQAPPRGRPAAPSTPDAESGTVAT